MKITLTAWLVILSFFCTQAKAAEGLVLSKEISAGKVGQGNEFISGDYPGAVLMRVNLWGAVGKSGIHFVPTQTDLVTLLSYAGGPTEAAQLSDVFIKRWSRGKQQMIKVDAEDLIRGTHKEIPVLVDNDVIVVPTKKPVIGSDTITLISVVSSLASLVALGLVLTKQ